MAAPALTFLALGWIVDPHGEEQAARKDVTLQAGRGAGKHTGTTPFPLVSKATAVIAVGSRADVAWIRRQDSKAGKSAADDGLPSAYGDFSRFFCILVTFLLTKHRILCNNI